MLKSASGAIAELCARSLQPPHSPWLDLATVSGPLTQEMLQKAAGGIVFVADLAGMGKLQQMNLAFALDRLEKQRHARLRHDEAGHGAGRCGLGQCAARPHRRGLAGLATAGGTWRRNPEIASLLLTHLAERGGADAPAVGERAQCAAHAPLAGRLAGAAGGGENLALTALEDEILAEDVGQVL